MHRTQELFKTFNYLLKNTLIPMTLRTKESLQRMFEERKRIQQKKQNREERKKQKKQLLQAIYRHQDQILKKALQDERKKVMDNLSTLIKKTPQEPRKPSQIELENYQDRWMLWETNESDLYTLDELKNIEELYPNETGRIRWDVWNQVVSETKKNISTLINQYERQGT